MSDTIKGKTICVDFDGVIHSYTSGWHGASVIPCMPVPGAFEWLYELIRIGADVCVYSSRSKEEGGIEAMKAWFRDHGFEGAPLAMISFPTEKPAAYLTIDDRAICFRGTFPSVREMEHFRPWNK